MQSSLRLRPALLLFAPLSLLLLTTACSEDARGTSDGGADAGEGDAGTDADTAECHAPSECPETGTVCSTRTCEDGTCGVSHAALGTACAEGQGVVCDGNGACVAMHCMDGVTDADESDEDCGGEGCAPCALTRRCRAADDCASALCDVGGTETCVECLGESDCPDPGNECLVRTCDAHACGTSPLDQTHALVQQTPGDCATAVCDGAGGTTSVGDVADVPSATSVCTLSVSCAGDPPIAVYTPASEGSDCSADGMAPRHVCGGGALANVCVQCNVPADCPATGNECLVPTCELNVCGIEALGTSHATSTGQTPGDCSKVVCDGAGGTTTVADASDLPVSTTLCQVSPSCGGDPFGPSFTNASEGTSCVGDGQLPKRVCGGGSAAGTCVQCNVPSDCPATGNECIVPTCNSNVCGTERLGTSHVARPSVQTPGDCQKIVCNGAGGFTSADDLTDVPAPSSSSCLINPQCDVSGGPATPSYDVAMVGTSCVGDGHPPAKVCGDWSNNAAGVCVECNVDADCLPSQFCDGTGTCL